SATDANRDSARSMLLHDEALDPAVARQPFRGSRRREPRCRTRAGARRDPDCGAARCCDTSADASFSGGGERAASAEAGGAGAGEGLRHSMLGASEDEPGVRHVNTVRPEPRLLQHAWLKLLGEVVASPGRLC